ncbi:MAG: family 16 glycosylhydrolase [Muribaculaceae bacterium]|nr:family 16 glycosylhydrolase [Muribaculaceae bacterium]
MPVQNETTVTVTPESFNVAPEASKQVLKVEANADWAVRCSADWISLTPSGGAKDIPTQISISVKVNDTFDERQADIEVVSGGKVVKTVKLVQGYVLSATASTSSIALSGAESTTSFVVTANGEWTLNNTADWLTLSPEKGDKGEVEVSVKASENTTASERVATITLNCGDTQTKINVTQLTDAITIPDGYTLVWSDEFNGGPTLGKEWVAENWPAGYVNNELQIYTSNPVDGKSTLEVKDGFLNINCFKASDGKIYSGRVNAMPNKGWLYGYFEARILLPSGKGTWPAFWMMPCNVDWSTNPWPRCGEIDIMEEVGANPNYVSSSLHTENYNHTKNTQKTHEMYLAGAEGSFHIYACEWTEDEIITYVDGKEQLRATRASMGSDHASWPFHYAFYPILNLAWGGDWGGYKGVDDKALPVTMKIDYVRIFQKK